MHPKKKKTLCYYLFGSCIVVMVIRFKLHIIHKNLKTYMCDSYESRTSWTPLAHHNCPFL